MTKIHVIGPVVRAKDHTVRLRGVKVSVKALYQQLRRNPNFTATVPEIDAALDTAAPGALFAAMEERVRAADRVVWVYHEEPAGAIEAGIALMVGRPLHILAGVPLPRIIRGIPDVKIAETISALEIQLTQDENAYA